MNGVAAQCWYAKLLLLSGMLDFNIVIEYGWNYEWISWARHLSNLNYPKILLNHNMIQYPVYNNNYILIHHSCIAKLSIKFSMSAAVLYEFLLRVCQVAGSALYVPPYSMG